MSSLNKVTLIGNVVRDPEIKALKSGEEVVNLSIATSQSWKDKQTGERKEKPEWHRVVVFNEHLVDVVKKYVKKGTKLYLEGQLQTRKWTDQNGVEKYTTEVVLQKYRGEIILLSSKENTEPNQENKPEDNFLDDDIPF